MPLPPNMEISEYLEIFRRRKWFIVFSILTILFGAIVYCVIAPESYKSSTTIFVIAPGVAEEYVRSTSGTRGEERIFSLRQKVMSRTNLMAVMSELGLYKGEKKSAPAEALVEMMRKNIEIQVASNALRRERQGNENAFTITFSHPDPRMAQLTASRLASFFVEENVKTRAQQAEGTSEFLESQLKTTKGRLEVQEEKVKQYKLRYVGELPQQLQANLQILSRLQDQARINSDASRSARDRKVFVESQLRALEAQLKTTMSQTASETGTSSEDAIFNDLAAKRVRLAELSAKFTPMYPEIRRLREEISQQEKRLEERHRVERERGNTPEETPPRMSRPLATSSQGVGAREREEIQRLRLQVAALDIEIESLKNDRVGIDKSSAQLETRVEKSPRREQEMVSLTRDYENLKRSYDDLLRKKLDAEMGQNLEVRQKGEKFTILDPANLPREPFSPNRPVVFGIAFVVAFMVGFGGAIGQEVVMPTLRGKRDFHQFFNIPVLASIPVINDAEYERHGKRRRMAIYGGLISFFFAITVFLILFASKIQAIFGRTS